MEEMGDGSAVVLANGTIIDCNDRLGRILGAPRQDILGCNLEDLVDIEDFRNVWEN